MEREREEYFQAKTEPEDPMSRRVHSSHRTTDTNPGSEPLAADGHKSEPALVRRTRGGGGAEGKEPGRHAGLSRLHKGTRHKPLNGEPVGEKHLKCSGISAATCLSKALHTNQTTTDPEICCSPNRGKKSPLLCITLFGGYIKGVHRRRGVGNMVLV